MRHGHNRMQSTSIVIFLNRELSKMFVRAVPLRLSWHAYSNWEPFVFCPRCENVSAFTWMFLNKTSATNWPVFHLHEYLKYFSPLYLSCSYTVLQVIMLISKHGKEAALGIYAYSHCLHLLFISCICFSGEKSDLPCSGIRCYFYIYFQSSADISGACCIWINGENQSI